MTAEEINLLDAAFDFLGPTLADSFEDAAVCEVLGPQDRFFSMVCEDHGVDPGELAILLEPPADTDLRRATLQVAAILVDQMRKEQTA